MGTQSPGFFVVTSTFSSYGGHGVLTRRPLFCFHLQSELGMSRGPDGVVWSATYIYQLLNYRKLFRYVGYAFHLCALTVYVYNYKFTAMLCRINVIVFQCCSKRLYQLQARVCLDMMVLLKKYGMKWSAYITMPILLLMMTWGSFHERFFPS